MRIHNITPIVNRNKNLNPQFQGNSMKIFTTPMGKTRVSNGLTELDKLAFRTYMNSKQYTMGLTHGEIKALSQYEGEEFITRAYKFITRKMAILEDVAPKLEIGNIDCVGRMCYDNIENSIIVDINKVKNSSKAAQFGALRHEVQHFFQSIMMLIHEDIGEKYIASIVDTYRDRMKSQIFDYINKTSVEEFSKVFQDSLEPDEMINFVKDIKSGNNSLLNSIIEVGVDRYKESLSAFREKVVKQYGVIKKESSLTPEIQKYLDHSTKRNYYKKDGSIDVTKYCLSIKEQDAILAQNQATFEFSESKCFMSFYKKVLANMLQD